MLRILSWNSTTGFEKMPSHDDSSPALICAGSGLSSANLSGKRKRSFAVDTSNMMTLFKQEQPIALPVLPDCSVQSPQEVQVPKPEPVVSSGLPSSGTIQDVCPPSDVSMDPVKARSKDEAQLATMRQTISSQLSLEILMKHRELRFIDQELAKCQVALEQLRRCTEIPYPVLQAPSEQVSNGSGPAIRKPVNKKAAARSPAAWGVTDGPYSRHYARWLLSDPHFDGGDCEPMIPLSTASTPLHGRSTRGVYTDFAQMVGKTSRSQRALHQGLPAGFVEPKQKPTGPMILKRKSDGKMVKLVCPDCARFDFGSAQGFINHCRIGHQRNFASHDAAAEGCGQALDADESVPAKTIPADPIHTPVVVTPITPVTPSLQLPVTTTAAHPLIRAAHLSKSSISEPLVPGGYIPKSERNSQRESDVEVPVQHKQTPNLSAYIQKHGLDVNLAEAVEDAKMRDDLDDEFEVEHMEIDTPLPTPTGNKRHPTVAGKKPSSKSIAKDGGRKPSFVRASIDTTGDHDYHGFMPLLPSPTNDSTQAPSLIDDDEEMEAGSPPSSDEHDESDIQVQVRDDEHPEDTHELSRGELTHSAVPCQPNSASEQTSIPRPTNFARTATKQYNFITERPMDADHGDRKRRKLGSD